MQTQIKTRQKQTIWSKLCQCLGLLLFSFILTACGQSANPQQGVISDDKLSAPLPKAITALLVDDTSLIVDVVLNGDTDNPLRVEELIFDADEDTFSGDVSGVPTGTSTLSLVYSIIDPTFGTIEVIRTADITVNVVANEDTPADFSSADITYTDTDGDGISNLDELDAGTDPRTPNYTVGGQVEGLTGNGLVLQNNGSDNLTISANGAFSFSPTAIDGDEYAVSVLTQPGNPNQTCIVNNGNGSINGTAVSNVTVICSTVSYTVGGTVSGYTGSGLVLQNNGSDDLTISKNGTFTFSSAIIDESEYAVSVQTLPNSPNQICSVSNGSGTLGGAAISNVAITCSTNAYTVGGTVSGYTGSGLVLQNNDSDDLPMSADGTFSFSNALVDGSEYAVSVQTQPSSPNQVCTVSNGSGIISGAAVSNVAVACLTTSYTVGGTISGYTGSGLILQINDSDDLTINAEGNFTFDSAVADGSEYTVTVLTQPNSPNQVCTVNNGNGTISGAPVSGVAVTCSTTSYSVGGTISGYTGSGLVLQINDSDDLAINAEGNFTFAVADGNNYTVRVRTQPNNPNQICTVSIGSGTIRGAPVSDVAVTCLTTSYTIGGTVSGYTGNGLVLQNNDGDDLTINAEENFTFGSAVADGGEYTVTVLTQPNSPNQVCTVSNGSGTISGAAVTNVTVTCETTSYTIGGTITGLVGDGLVLQNNDGNDLVISTNGDFAFTTALIDGSDYAVTVFTQPDSPNQTCTVNNDKGTVSSAAVTNITVACKTTSYTIGGTITGLVGDGLVLQNNGSDDLVIGTNGDFAFTTALTDGSDYAVTVFTLPDSPNQTCTVSNDKGTINSTTVIDVTVTCVTVNYTVGGTVTGLIGGELVLQNNGGDDLVISADGNFTFTTTLSDGSVYAVTVLTPPAKPNQRCTVESGEGFLEGGNANVTVNCQLLLFISADDGQVGRELFATDGTEAGTFLVKDINTNTNADPRDLVVVNGVTYFVATDGMTGDELWKTNGTAIGTVLVKDIRPGSGSAFLSDLTAVGSTLYFSANDIISGSELWRSDGSAVGTVIVKDIDPGTRSAFPSDLTAVGSTLYFSANDSTSGIELWKSDGTDAGTVLVKDIRPGSSSASLSSLTVVSNTLYFSANDGTNGSELWKSDGTDAGTVLVKDIRPGSGSAFPDSLTAVGSTLYFIADDGINGSELWKSDGTDAGTVLVKDIRPGSGGANFRNLTAVGSTLYFSAFDGINDSELWKSDGTAAGTVLVKNIRPGSGSAFPDSLTAVGNTLYFSADDGTGGRELWKSDGTAVGTVMVKDIWPGSNGANPLNLTAVGNTLYFSAYEDINGRELWKSDGTAAGTILLNDTWLGEGNSSPDNFSVIGDVVYFAAHDGTNGRELWRSDGTANGTYLLADIGSVGADSTPSQVITIGETSYFTANDGTNENRALWRSDGTTAGTVLVKNINITSSSLTATGNTLYFSANDGTNGSELWKSDGTDAGTVMVKDIRPGSGSAQLENLMAVNNMLYFTADDGVTGEELWKSDGTDAGTVMVKDIRPGSGSAFLNDLTAVGSTLYFSAYEDINGIELWKSDGTTVGTVLVKDILPGSGRAFPRNLTAVGSTLYFSADDGINNRELWKSDGTDAGTVMVKDIWPGSNGANPHNLTAVGNTLYFSADDGSNGSELWKSDGTDAGTVLVKDIQPGLNRAFPGNLMSVDDTLYFTANGADRVGSGAPRVSRDLWKSDGTEAGTVLMKNIWSGLASPDNNFTVVGNMLYFSVRDSVSGRELWKSDGTEAGTALVKDINPFNASSNPVPLNVK